MPTPEPAEPLSGYQLMCRALASLGSTLGLLPVERVAEMLYDALEDHNDEELLAYAETSPLADGIRLGTREFNTKAGRHLRDRMQDFRLENRRITTHGVETYINVPTANVAALVEQVVCDILNTLYSEYLITRLDDNVGLEDTND